MERINVKQALESLGITIPEGSALEHAEIADQNDKEQPMVHEPDTDTEAGLGFFDDEPDFDKEYDGNGNVVEYAPPEPQPTHPSADAEKHLDDAYNAQREKEDTILMEQVRFTEPPALATVKWYTPTGLEMFYCIRDIDDASVLARLKVLKGNIEKSLKGASGGKKENNEKNVIENHPDTAPKQQSVLTWNGGEVNETSPEKVQCPVHTHLQLSRRQRKDGTAYFYSHKVGDTWCYGKPPKE